MSIHKNIYIVLTANETLFSTVIGWFTRAPLNHASLAFDGQLREVYSFGRKKAHNPFIGGLIRENFRDSFYRDSECAIFQLKVTSEEYDRMYSLVQSMMSEQERYKYHLLGLLGVLLNVRLEREDAYFCSQFVASVLEQGECSPVAKPACFVRPDDFSAALRTRRIYKGKLVPFVRNAQGSSWREPEERRYAMAGAQRLFSFTQKRAKGM